MSDPTQEQVNALRKTFAGYTTVPWQMAVFTEHEIKQQARCEEAEKLGHAMGYLKAHIDRQPTIDNLKTNIEKQKECNAKLTSTVRQTHAEFLKVFSEDHVPEKLQKTYSLFHKLNNCQSVALELTRYEHRKKPLSRQAVHKRLLQLDRITEGKLCIAEQLKRTRLSEQAKRTESRRIEDERRDKVAKRY